MRPHLLDRLAPIGFLLDRRSRVFPEGWGETDSLASFDRPLAPTDPITHPEVTWSRKEEHRGFRTRRAVFASPDAAILPEPARPVTVEWIDPAAGAERVVVLLPAWNDETFEVRRDLAGRLAGLRIGSLIADIPFYGARRVRPETGPAIGSVADFARMAHGAVSEARALLALASDLGFPGVAGFSMGGNLAAYASATVPMPVATAPLAASPSPGPIYADAALSGAVAWQALGGRASARDRLRTLLDRASVLHLPALPHHPAAVLVAGERDGFVPAGLSRDLAAHWGAELRVVEGAGHGWLLWRRKDVLVEAIADSFERLDH